MGVLGVACERITWLSWQQPVEPQVKIIPIHLSPNNIFIPKEGNFRAHILKYIWDETKPP